MNIHYRICHKAAGSTVPDHAACNPDLKFPHESPEWAWEISKVTCPECLKMVGKVFTATVLDALPPMGLSQAGENLVDADRKIDLARKNMERYPSSSEMRDAYNAAMAAYEIAYADYSAARKACEKIDSTGQNYITPM